MFDGYAYRFIVSIGIICGLLTSQYLAINDDLEAAQTLFQQDFITECLIEGCFVMW